MIAPGKKLGPYEIASLIGVGGMGEVYKARDTRLDRIVAIKVLSAHMADLTESRERFEREARTVASLNHPHICTLHDIGRHDGVDFLVMEYLEGETLATRLMKGALPLDQVLRYAIEIADALDKAHRKGITHRDIKPGNIMLLKSGAKLLDFGLAKLRQDSTTAATPPSQLPTLSNNYTAEGTVLGTLQYMAPEQVEGKNHQIDRRTDIFAFGAVVYEMATGKKAFEGKTNASVIGAILHVDPPPISSLQPMTPSALDRAVKTCLAKDPDERWQTASDLCRELKWIAENVPAHGAPSIAEQRIASPGKWGTVPTFAILSFAAIITALTFWLMRPDSVPAPKPVSRLIVALPSGQQLAGTGVGSPVALSRDGTHLAYVAREGVEQRLYLRPMDNADAVPIVGTEGALTPSFSPDGQKLLFFADGKLKTVSVKGGTALSLGDSVLPAGASWSSQGIVGFGFYRGPIQQVPESGGATQSLTHVAEGETGHFSPEFLPGGKAALFVVGKGAKKAEPKIVAELLATGERHELVEGVQPHYAASGHLVYARGRTLMAVPFDASRMVTTGAPVAMVENVAVSPAYAMSQYTISDNGSLAYVSGGARDIQRKLVWVDRSGAEQVLSAPPKAYESISLSPDGRRVAVGLNEQIWLYDFARESLSRLTLEADINALPVWSPDGNRIAFFSSKDTVEYNLWWQSADGSGGLQRLTTREYANNPRSFSPDGRILAYVEFNPKTQGDIWVVQTDDGKAQLFLATPFMETTPTFSPDGHWLAYLSNESGRQEVYVQPYPGPGKKWQVSTEGGMDPKWNRNGRELFFRNGDKVMAVDVTTVPNFYVGKPRLLFEGQYLAPPGNSSTYAPSADGRRFLMIKATEEAKATVQINVVLNWFEELKRRVPLGTK